MPRKNNTKLPSKVIAQAVRRHLEKGENVAALATEYGVGRSSMYGWVESYRKKLVEKAASGAMAGLEIDSADNATLIDEIVRLRAELTETRSKLVARMIKLGEI